MPSRSHSSPKPHHFRVTWPRVAGIVVVVLLIFAAGRHWLSLENLRSHRDALIQFVDAHYWGSLLILGLVTILQTAVSLPFSPFLVILGGMVFGLWIGTVYKVITTTIGSVLALLIVRYLFKDFARRQVKRHPKAEQVLESFKHHPNSYLLFLRFEPGMPLWIANIVCALADIGLLRFFLLTLVGVIPDTFIFANVGANLAKLKSGHDLLSPGMIAALALVALLALTPVAITKLRGRHGHKTG